MYNPTQSHRGSALIVGLIIVVLLTILTTSFLEKILNLGKTSGGIGNSAQSYYLATGLIEEQLMDGLMTRAEPWKIPTKIEGTAATGRTLTAYTGGTMMPEQGAGGLPGKGNSSFDSNWNIIGIGEPVQIVIPAGIIDWSTVIFHFRVPSILGAVSNTGSSSSSGVILWTFGYSGASLYASGETEIFQGIHITNNTPLPTLTSKNGLTNTGVSMQFGNFYSAYGSNCAGFQCTLKLSMIRSFVTDLGQSFPFLEYQISFPVTIPSQYMIIDSSAYVLGYLRSRQVRIPQITTNTATDFAILQ